MRISDWSSDLCSSDLKLLFIKRKQPCIEARPQQSIDHSQVLVEYLKNVAQGLGTFQFLTTGEYDVLDRAAVALLGDGIERRVVGVAEHREDRRAAELVDGVVPPLAAGDVAADRKSTRLNSSH